MSLCDAIFGSSNSDLAIITVGLAGMAGGVWVTVSSAISVTEILNRKRDEILVKRVLGERMDPDHRLHVLNYDWWPINLLCVICLSIASAVFFIICLNTAKEILSQAIWWQWIVASSSLASIPAILSLGFLLTWLDDLSILRDHLDDTSPITGRRILTANFGRITKRRAERAAAEKQSDKQALAAQPSQAR